jgi:hypothetical protein
MKRLFTYAARTALCVGSLVVLSAGTAAAQEPGVGVRAGVSVDPDQFYFGGHYETAPLVDRLRFRPNVEVGLGDDVTHLGFNVEFAYFFPSQHPWQLYAGGGPALNVYDFENDTDTQAGFNVLVGAQSRQGLFVEFKVGLVDSPELKFGVGYTWR